MGGTLSQPYVFAAAMYSGMLCACLYMLLCAVCKIARIKILRIVLDCIFAVLTVAIIFITLYFSSNASLRIYQFLGVLLGFALMHFTIRPILQHIYEFFHRCVDKKQKKGSNIR